MDFTSGSGGELGTRGTADRLASNRRTARPDGRAFLRPLGAGSPRGGALRGASALAPGLGLVAASVWARPFGRALRPGPRPSPPHTPPARLGAAEGKAGERGLPSAPSGRVPPAPCGLRAATPAHPGRLGRRPPRPPAAVGEMWRRSPPAAAQVKPPPAVARGHPSAKQGQAPSGPLCGPCFAPPPRRLRRRCSGPPRPHEWGLWGVAALRPGRACLRPAAPRWPACGAACAAAALPPLGPPGVAAPPAAASRRRAAGGVRASLACGPCPGPWPSRSARPVRGRNLDAARKGLARFAGRGPIPRRARLWRGVTPPAGGSATSPTIRQGQVKPPAAGLV